MPAAAVITVTARSTVTLSPDGEIKSYPHDQARMIFHKRPVIVCHAPYTRHRLGTDDLITYDVLELFAFVHPAKFCVPTPFGIANALGIHVGENSEDAPLALHESVRVLLSDLRASESDEEIRANLLGIADAMGAQGKGWVWTPYIFSALNAEYNPERQILTRTALNIWKNLPEWSEGAPPPPAGHDSVSGEEARERLRSMLTQGRNAEPRPQQMDYTGQMASIFAPAQNAEQPHVLLAEAGTGVGKTLGYLAPASVWAEKNGGPVWVSTYTRNLQRQIGQELERLYPDPMVRDRAVAIRKGRENYLCLLNYEDLANAAALARHVTQIISAGLMARWISATKDGDLSGGDFPGWLPALLGYGGTTSLADKRGECIHSACDHYHRCFVERSIRKARHADIVVANHALVMINTALAGNATPDDQPHRYVFDEGHHLFDAADGAFSGNLSARETADLRRWIFGQEGGKRSRARGLKRRMEDLIAGDAAAEEDLEKIIQAAHSLPGPGWSKRFKEHAAFGATEQFLALVYQQVYARADGRDGPYSLECTTLPLIDGLGDAARLLKTRLNDLRTPMMVLAGRLRRRLGEQSATLDTDTRRRLESVAASLQRRGEMTIGAWIAMLDTLESGNADDQFVDWMEIERIEGQAIDVGLYRHWIDPMIPFAAAMKTQAHGIAITSATLRDGTGDDEEDWRVAIERTGALSLTPVPHRFAVSSPYNYADQTRVYIITDVRKDDLDQVAGAYQALFEAAGGGGLGLFTAIQRLRIVRDRIAPKLEDNGIALYAQHVDEMDTGTLVDIFRADTHACLLGTDAVRDGVDVPGDSLRMLVYDRVPWTRPTILHKARREAFGKRRYDELLTRLKLRQAFGRLVRRADDRGVFVMLDSMLPTRLHGAFPDGVKIERVGLADAVKGIKDFWSTDSGS